MSNVSRENALKEGTIFKYYNYYSTFELHHRLKLAVNTSSSPLLSIHSCTGCTINRINSNHMHIYHLKVFIPGEGRLILDKHISNLYEKHSFIVRQLQSRLSSFQE